MELKTINAINDGKFTYARIGYVPDHPTNGNLIWHFYCLGRWNGDVNIDGERMYQHPGYDEYDGFVISAPTELDAIRIACEQIDKSLESDLHWTIELVGATLISYDNPIIMKSNTGA